MARARIIVITGYHVVNSVDISKLGSNTRITNIMTCTCNSNCNRLLAI